MALTEKAHAGGFILSEATGNRSKTNGTLISGQNLKAGAVVGKIITDTATSAAKSGGNTGGGTCTMDGTTPVLAKAKVGVYQVRCIGLVANGGQFTVHDPDGVLVGLAYAGVAFARQIKFTLADVGTDFAIGDGFDITVTAGSGKYTELAPAANDGSAKATGVLFAPTDATSADKACVVFDADGELNSNEIVWPSGISDANKAIATAELLAAGIKLR